jgi:RimJ/RimL family protein N-acetyltransferase
VAVTPDFAAKPTLFRPEGVLRESLRYGNQWIDATVMSILAAEWPPPAG